MTTHAEQAALSDLDPLEPDAHERTRPYRRHGTVLSVGAVARASSQVVIGGVDPAMNQSTCSSSGPVRLLSSWVCWPCSECCTAVVALGQGAVARGVLHLETALVSMAIASTTVDALGISDLDQPGWAALDATWRLSMLGMFLIGIRVALAGRWRGAARFWP
jgi:hypothetical protein